MREVVIVGAKRTPIGDYLGSLKDVSAVRLGIVAAKGAMEQAGIGPGQIEDVTCGMVYKEGVGGNPARQIQLQLGIPAETCACTVDQQCGSAMRAFEIATQQIFLGKADVALCLGIESMSRVPHLVLNIREGVRMGDTFLYDALTYDALVDINLGYHMGVTAENVAELYDITRQEQDELAVMSQQRASKAIAEEKFKDEIVPVEIETRKGATVVDTDEHPRADASIEKMAKLKPAFKKDGTVTAANASGINDGAAALVIMSAEKAQKLGIKPLAKVLSTAGMGVKPEVMGLGPAYAIPKALAYAGLTQDQIDYFEINEAFAAQWLGVNRILDIPFDKINANGSGIALGHPVGCTGIRIIVSLLYEMQKRNAKYGCASLCVGGGPAMATIVER
ncbi:thiolase family protein [Candidatus Formimonas warabiya]|uniref:Acetyl-CoA acetyltransferase n=1 Tax=Formimonas warabiya TaxID=1761012 RepID=A0A3G1KWM7_FORW1|nr:acetyl-CoA C-acetyltransferase [Candidatus Formimonas warabiya]ATW26605.1 acetyl-CoA acetyltransferase [Candidatus Formimonas warabiya]